MQDRPLQLHLRVDSRTEIDHIVGIDLANHHTEDTYSLGRMLAGEITDVEIEETLEIIKGFRGKVKKESNSFPVISKEVKEVVGGQDQIQGSEIKNQVL